jgi:type I restriction enzyme M protein
MRRADIVRKIEELDPKQEVVSIDLSNNTITYSKDIIQHRVISKITGDEEVVRAYFVTKLISELGYKKQDIELEKEYEAGRPKTIKPRIDILLKDKRSAQGKTFLFIEVKAPDKYEHDKEYIRTQLFELSKLEDKKSPINYLVYCTADFRNEQFEEKNIIIDYLTYSDYDEWEENGKLALDIFPKDYGEPRKARYIKGVKDLDTRVSKAQFDLLRKDLHDVLWGGGGANYNEIFVNLVKIFLAKIFDENNTDNGQAYKFQVEYMGRQAESSEEVFNKINKLYLDGCKSYLGFSDDELRNEGLNKRNISPNKVRYVVEQLQGISLTKNENNENDLLGDFFEGIVTQGFKQDKGQFFTHINIVRFLIYGLGIDDFAVQQVNKSKSLPFICDPACGSGTFLIEVMKIITDTIKRRRKNEVSTSNDVQLFVQYKMPDVKENTWAWDYLYGIEINPDLALATKVNMVLHGDGSGNIYSKDALLPFEKYENFQKISVLSKSKKYQNYSYPKDVNEQFDFIISNPPFSIKLDNETKKLLPSTFEYGEAASSENLFVERYYQLLKEGGKAGVVLPESIFDTGDNRYLRLFIYKYFRVKAIISLPSGKNGAFLPYTPIKTSLLFIEKKSKSEVEGFEREWRDRTNQYNALTRRIKNIALSPIETEEHRNILREYLKHYFDSTDETLSVQEIVARHSEDINEISKNPDWWIFSEVSPKFDYKIYIAHPKALGYHRTKNREFKRENQLFAIDEKETVTPNLDQPSKVLDYLRSGKFIDEPNQFYINFSDIARSVTLRLDHRFYRYIFFEEPVILESFKRKPFLLRDAIISIRNGKDVERGLYSVDATGNILETEYKYLTINNIRPDGFLLDDVINLMTKAGEGLSKFQLQKDEVIITRSGTVGICKVVDLDGENITYIPSGYLIVVNVDQRKLKPEFMAHFLNTIVMKKYFEVFGTGKTQQNISQGDIKRIPIPSFTIKEQEYLIGKFKQLKYTTSNEIAQKRREVEFLRQNLEATLQDELLNKRITIELEDE